MSEVFPASLEADPTRPWAEPTSLLPLRWGRYRPRVVAGMSMIIIGVASVLVTTAYSLQFLALGCLLQAVGWTVMPSAGWRRVTVVVPAVAGSCLLLGGGGFIGAFGILLAAWLLVRHRPLAAYPVIAPPVLLGIGISGVAFSTVVVDYQYAWVALVIAGALTVGCAWSARTIAIRVQARRRARRQARSVRTEGVPDGSAEASVTHATLSRDTDELR